MSWNGFPTWSVGQVSLASDWNTYVAANMTYLYEKPYIRAYALSNATNMSESTTTQITLDTVQSSGYGFTLSSNNLITPQSGTYIVMGQIGLQTYSATYPLDVNIYHNGVQITGDNTFGTNFSACLLTCAANDTIGLYGFQTSSGVLTNGLGSACTYLHAQWQGSI